MSPFSLDPSPHLLLTIFPLIIRYNISYVQANPDGLFERQAVGVNGTWP